jgi:pyruvate dehydrogenase E2 component (dihydrolipoamide acetyltransferase)
MATDFFIPMLGQTVEEVTLIEWLVEDGAQVESGQPILEVETDKAVFPVEANASGYLHIGPYQKGDVVPVITIVAVIGSPEEKFIIEGEQTEEASSSQAQAIAMPDKPAPASGNGDEPVSDKRGRTFISPRARVLARKMKLDISKIQPTGGMGRRVIERDVLAYLSQMPKATPIAQRIAAEAGVHLEAVQGTGFKGRITREDVERSIGTSQLKTAVGAQPEHQGVSSSSLPLTESEVLERIPLVGVRSIIAERMAMSVHTSARVTLMMEVDATELSRLRERLKVRVETDWGFAPGYNDLLAKIVAAALRKFNYMNARLTDEAIEILKPVNLGMAVDTERGLLVPVIRNADQKSLRQFGLEFRELVGRARNGRSLPDDLTGGTFTLTNLGSFEIDGFTPVINLPEAAILGVGRIASKAVPIDKEITIREMCTLSLVFDHRVVDGAPAARFLQYIKSLIEEPYLLISALQET